MPRIAIPGLVDVLVTKDPGLIRTLGRDSRLDRHYVPRGRLLNRLVLGRLRRVLQLNGKPLPPVSERGARRPTPEQKALEDRLDAVVAAGIAGEDVEALARYVQGQGKKSDAGRLAQQAVGRLFTPTFEGTEESWAAAKVLGAAPSNMNPLRAALWAITGRVTRARASLAAKVGGDPSGLHGAGVAIHNLAEAFQRMRRLHEESKGRPLPSTEAAVACSLVGPRQVLRQPTCSFALEAGRLKPDTLVILQLQAANAQCPGYDAVFMSDTWSQCPAHRWVPELLAAVWRRAVAEPGR